MKIAAASSVSKCICASESELFQPAICNVVRVAEQTAQFRTAVFRTVCVPETIIDRNVKIIFAAVLGAFPQIGRANYLQKQAAVYGVNPGTNSIFAIAVCDFAATLSSRYFLVHFYKRFELFFPSLIQNVSTVFSEFFD